MQVDLARLSAFFVIHGNKSTSSRHKNYILEWKPLREQGKIWHNMIFKRVLTSLCVYLLYPLSFDDWDFSSPSLFSVFPRLAIREPPDSLDDIEAVSSDPSVTVRLTGCSLVMSDFVFPVSDWDASCPALATGGGVPASPHPNGTLLILVRAGLTLGGEVGTDPVLSRGVPSAESGEGCGLETENGTKKHLITFDCKRDLNIHSFDMCVNTNTF